MQKAQKMHVHVFIAARSYDSKLFIELFYFVKVFVCRVVCNSVTGGELFEDIVAREFYSEADARYDLLLALRFI